MVKLETHVDRHLGDETYLLAQSSHQACPWSASKTHGERCRSGESGRERQRRRGTPVAGGATSVLPEAARTCSRSRYSGLLFRNRLEGSYRVQLADEISYKLHGRMKMVARYRTSVRDAPDRARRDHNYTRLGLYQLVAEEMRQVMVGFNTVSK